MYDRGTYITSNIPPISTKTLKVRVFSPKYMVEKCKTLSELWAVVHRLNKQHFPKNKLKPILGNGKIFRPKVMFTFINPTAKNISSNPKWNGPRFPFIGTKHVWRIFHKAGLFDDILMEKINETSNWSLKFTNEVLEFLRKKSFYFTNIVKWTGHDAALPDSKKIRLFLPILRREIELVQSEYVVTFGLVPFEKLTGNKIKLIDYYSDVMKNNKLKFYEVEINSAKTKVIPCYFPVGRGDPKKAIEILKLVDTL